MERFDFVGVGAGPSNLSLAALAQPVDGLRGGYLEARTRFQWHPGIMLPGAQLQVSYLKDLVTLVDPTSRFSFLNYLVEQGRIFRSLVANEASCSRLEFEQYYQWAAAQIPGIRWGWRVRSVDVVGDHFEIRSEDGERIATPALVLGSGKQPVVPDFATGLRGPRVLHSSEMLTVRPEVRGRRVVVVGAGQSGAEIVNYLLSDDRELPASLTWLSSRVGFLPLDDSPFTNEWFAPPYSDYFYQLPPERRTALLGLQRMASDGVSESLLRNIYRRLYQLDIVGSGLRHHLLPSRRMLDLRGDGEDLVATLHNADTGRLERCGADVVVFCTGYRSTFPGYLDPLRERIVGRDGTFRVRPDYSLDWDGPEGLRIYVQNGAENTHGIADPNLSLMAWRSARVINSLVGREVYRLDRATSTTAWNWAPDGGPEPVGEVGDPLPTPVPAPEPITFDLAQVEG